MNNTSENLSLTIENITEVGKKLKEEHSRFRAFSDFVAGCRNVTVSLKEILQILDEKCDTFNGKFLLLATNDLDELRWDGQGHLTRKHFLKLSHGFFSSNEKTRDFLLGKTHRTVDEYIKEFKNFKPCVHGSDAHSFEDICNPNEDRFCWIKADTSFKGLKQIKYEPEERVIIQKDFPENRKKIYTLESVKIQNSDINDNLSLQEDYIPLNKDLIVVTGGKGSGKTALLDLIANCFFDRCKRGKKKNEDRNSFVQRIEKDKPDLEVEIGFIGEGLDKFSKKITEEKLFEDSKIMYLPQGKIEEFSGDKSKLSEIIKDIISSNEDVIRNGCNERNKKFESEIKEIIENIEDINKDIDQLDKKTEVELFTKVERELRIKNGELKDKEHKLEEFKEKMKESKAESIEGLKEKQKSLRSEHSELESLKITIEKLNTELETYADNSNSFLTNINDKLQKSDIDVLIPELNFESQLNNISEILEILPKKIDIALNNVGKVEKDLEELSGDERTQAKLIEEMDSIKKDIAIIEKDLESLNENKEKIDTFESNRFEKYFSLLAKYDDWRSYYEEVIKIFSRGESKSEILKEVEFEPKIHFDIAHFYDLGYNLLNKRIISSAEIDTISNKLNDIINEIPVDKSKLEDFVNYALGKKECLKPSRTTYEFYEWIFGDYFSLNIDVLFNGTPIHKLSMGQKGTILLSLFLAEGDYPLIIDQPEDNLDNKFVYDVLKGAFRKAKTKRQIIIATNNANLVVNTDAEQVIIAEFNNGKISYKKGSLENPTIRKDIIPVLEGGKEAFRLREKKYGV